MFQTDFPSLLQNYYLNGTLALGSCVSEPSSFDISCFMTAADSGAIFLREIPLTSELHMDQCAQPLSTSGTLSAISRVTRALIRAQINHLIHECTNDVVDINEEGDMLTEAANDANHKDISRVNCLFHSQADLSSEGLLQEKNHIY